MTIREFYNSTTWKKQRKYKLQSNNYICDKCGLIATEVHHKIKLTETNVDDINISMNSNNLECLCRDCHNKLTHGKDNKTRFDVNGNLLPY